MQSPQQFASIVVRQQGERRVRLGDVADLELDQENYDFTQFSTDRPAIFLHHPDRLLDNYGLL